MKSEAKSSPVVMEQQQNVAILSLNRPSRRNALTRQARHDLTETLTSLARDTEIQAVVLASREAAFSAGQDLDEAKDFSPEHIGTWIDEHMILYRAILAYPRPILAAIDGCCVGAGLQMALLCDLRIGAPKSFFAMPELDDAIPCILGIWTLWDIIGRARTTEMVLTSRRVQAQEALAWGLLNQVVPPAVLLPKALELATQLASKPALAFRLTKDRVRLLTLQEAEALAVHAAYAHTVAFSSGQAQEAMQAFLKK